MHIVQPIADHDGFGRRDILDRQDVRKQVLFFIQAAAGQRAIDAANVGSQR